jgi:hypothetical protein
MSIVDETASSSSQNSRSQIIPILKASSPFLMQLPRGFEKFEGEGKEPGIFARKQVPSTGIGYRILTLFRLF